MAFYEANRRRYPEKNIAFSAGNPETTPIRRQHPIDRIQCRLTGNLVVATEAATLNPLGILNLINRLQLVRGGKDVLFSVRGHMLDMVSNIYTDAPAYVQQPEVAEGTNPFECWFSIPVNPGPGEFALLDASDDSTDLVLECQWGNGTTDVAEPGVGGTAAVANVQFEVWTMANAGGVPGQVGGIRANYPLHLITTTEINVTASTSELIQDLLKDHLYYRVLFKTLSDGVPVNTILNGAKVTIDTSVIQRVTGRELQLEAANEYNRPTIPDGEYVFDFMDDLGGPKPKISHLLGVPNVAALPFHLTLDVNNPGATDKIIMVSDRIARPSVQNSVRN